MARRRSKRLKKLLRAASRKGIMPSLMATTRANKPARVLNRGQAGFMDGCHQPGSNIRWATSK